MKKLGLVLFVLIFSSIRSFAEGSAPLIQHLNGTAWIRRESGATTAAEGQTLKSNEELTVLNGNKAVVQVDENNKNIVVIEGPAAIRISADGLAHIADLKEGKIFCLVDKMQEGSSFNVMTPVAVAAVRGTQFQVNSMGGKTYIFNYDGKIEVYPRRPDGLQSDKPLTLNKGEKAVFGDPDGNSRSSPMTKEEFSVIEDVREYTFGNTVETETPDTPAPTETKKEEKSDSLDVQDHWEE